MVCKIAWQDGPARATARRDPRSLPGKVLRTRSAVLRAVAHPTPISCRSSISASHRTRREEDGRKAISAINFLTMARPNELKFSATRTNAPGPPTT
jgi:hypothetical protein